MLPVDEIRLNFDPASLVLLNAVLGFLMFGIALDTRDRRLQARGAHAGGDGGRHRGAVHRAAGRHLRPHAAAASRRRASRWA